MRIVLLAGLSLLPQVTPRISAPVRYNAWQWQRAIQPAASAPADEQCVVLDADLYAAAAPGLRDVRLLQDDREISYALQESYDERALRGAQRADHSLYTTVLKIPLTSDGKLQKGTAVLLQHVPVERVELVADLNPAVPDLAEAHPSTSTVHIRLVVTPSAGAVPGTQQTIEGEAIEDDLDANNPVELTAIGANLQRSARVDLAVNPGEQHFAGALLQMHRRSLCYQPLSSAPLLLLYGNADAPPVRYGYAANYQPRAETLLAALGPVQRNGKYQRRAARTFTLTRRQRLAFAASIAVAGFLLTAVPLLQSR